MLRLILTEEELLLAIKMKLEILSSWQSRMGWR